MKQCTKCGEWKDEGAFRPKRRGCRECERIANQVYNAVHAEKKREYSRKYYQEHAEERQGYSRKYYQEHAEKCRAYTQKWRKENRNRYLTYKHSDQNRENNRNWYHRHKEERKQYVQLYRRLNKDKVNVRTHRRRARKKGNGGTFTAMQWRTLCQKYHYYCLSCGKREPEIKLTIDHVLPIQLGGTNTIDNIQPLCGECNTSKGPNHVDYRPDHTGSPQVEQLLLW